MDLFLGLLWVLGILVYLIGLYVYLPAVGVSLVVNTWAYYDATRRHVAADWAAIGEDRSHWVEHLFVTTVTVFFPFVGWRYLLGPWRKFRRLVPTG